MAESRIPEEIRKFRPEPCTEIKLINGHYYVYRYSSVRLPSGKWGKQSGKSIGTIVADVGFIPNKNYSSDSEDSITILEYGQYALIEHVAASIKKDLQECFPLDRAIQIFAYAVILYANDFVHVDQVQRFYEQGWLSLEYKSFTFKMGKTAISNLLDDLGRRTKRVVNYEQRALDSSSKEIAVDGHVVGSISDENDLGEAGYKFNKLGEDQVNYLMGYDIITGKPLLSRIFRGSSSDKESIKDLLEILTYTGVLFVVDRGFYSPTNLDLLSSNGNSYIIPAPSNTDAFKTAMEKTKYTKSFYYRSGKKHSRIEYRMVKISARDKVYVFRDIDENEKCRYNYLHCMELGKKGYTQEGFEEKKEFFGVYVLQTSSKKKAEEVFATYKKRWGIETFYQYLKNKGDFNDLMFQDYYKEQGFAFVMLIVGQIHQAMIKAVQGLNDNEISCNDILLMSRAMKLELRGQLWKLGNKRKRDLDLLAKMGFKPVLSISA